jgi:hypothetical protein
MTEEVAVLPGEGNMKRGRFMDERVECELVIWFGKAVRRRQKRWRLMVQARNLRTYGFLPWNLIYKFEEMEAQKAKADSTSTSPFSPPAEQATLAATEQHTPADSPVPEDGEGQQALTQVRFRRAVIAVDDPGDFWSGVTGGQVAALEEPGLLTGSRIFTLFEDAVRDVEFSETWLTGYLLGLSDALLRQRKLYPRAYLAHLQNRYIRKPAGQES